MSDINNLTGTAHLKKYLRVYQECVFWITAAVLLFLCLWSSSFTVSEVRLAEIIREMLRSGNWFSPTLNGETVEKSLLLNCWCAVPFCKLLGVTELALRIPGVLAAFGALYLLKELGRTLFQYKTASICGWLFLGSAGFLFYGRSAAGELISAAVVLLVLLWYFKTEEKRTFFRYALLYGLAFGSALFVGKSTFLIPLVILAVRSLSGARWKKELNWKNLLTFFLGGSIYFFCYYCVRDFSLAFNDVSSILYNGGMTLLRQFYRLRENWFFSFRDLFFYLLPWTPLLPVGIAGVLKNWKQLPPGTAMLLAGVCCAFLLCAVFAPGNSGITLVFMPLLLLFSAVGLDLYGVEEWNQKALTGAFYICIVLASVCICSIVTYPLWERIADYAPPAVLVLAPVGAGILGWLLLFTDHRNNNGLCSFLGLPHRLCSVLLTGTVLSGCAVSVVLPVVTSEFNMKKHFFTGLYNRVVEQSSRGEHLQVAVFDTRVPPGYLFYNNLNASVLQVDDLKELIEKYGSGKVVLLFRHRKRTLEKFDSQCRQYGIVPGKTFLVEEFSRWRAPDSREDHFVSYLITLPGKKSGAKKNNIDNGVPGLLLRESSN